LLVLGVRHTVKHVLGIRRRPPRRLGGPGEVRVSGAWGTVLTVGNDARRSSGICGLGVFLFRGCGVRLVPCRCPAAGGCSEGGFGAAFASAARCAGCVLLMCCRPVKRAGPRRGAAG